ncbi:hypothetical protein [Gallaecimonas sp. GXIMD4217]|uniref:hypothetical protein n=1 Tax=Gallaecimonas sp. GXIMD4217 TaxID=3131927 RepID=UPI00311B0264
MRFKQVRDLIDFTLEAHEALAKLYDRLSNQVDAERSRMMLHYLSEHERKVVGELQNYLDDAPDRLLDTWFDNASDSELLRKISLTQLPATADQQQILSLALDLDNRIIDSIAALVDNCPCSDSRTLLSNLVEVSRDRQHRFVHQTLRMTDI